MVKVKKRSGEYEDFNQAKLEASLRSAGAEEEQASRISELVARSLQDGTETDDIRAMAAAELSQIDEDAAQRYQSFKSATSQTTSSSQTARTSAR